MHKSKNVFGSKGRCSKMNVERTPRYHEKHMLRDTWLRDGQVWASQARPFSVINDKRKVLEDGIYTGPLYNMRTKNEAMWIV